MESEIKGFSHQVAKLEFRAGMESEATAKVTALSNDKSLNDVERLHLMRTLLIEDEDFADENASDADFETLLHDYRNRGALRSLPTTYREYGFFLERAGRVREALAMVRTAAELTEEAGWELHLPPLWHVLASMHDALGEHEEAAAWWVRIDALLAKMKASGKTVPAVRLLWVESERVDWLTRNGRESGLDSESRGA